MEYSVAPLVEDGDRAVSPSRFHREAASLAEALERELRGEALPVITPMGKSVEQLVAVAACLSTPGFIVPFDPRDPAEYARSLAAAWPRAVVVARDRRGLAPFCGLPGYATMTYRFGDFSDGAMADGGNRASRRGFDPRDPGANPHALAYAIMTSGSTGTPKAVPITRSSLASFARWVESLPPRRERERIAAMSPPTFDLSVWDWTRMLVHGSTLVLVPDALAAMPVDLTSFLRERRITSLCWVPSVLAKLRAAGAPERGSLPELDDVGFIGEAMPPSLLEYLESRLPDARFTHYYGPAEATVMASFWPCDRSFRDIPALPLGEPRPGVSFAVIAADGSFLTGEGRGELAISGECLTPGYVTRRDQSPAVDPFFLREGARWYRTGDVVDRIGGELYFVGRGDGQFKRRGMRLELGEVEAAIASCPGVAAAMARWDPSTATLAAHWAGDAKADPRGWLASRFPKRLMPDEWTRHDDLPIGPHGKFDRTGWFQA
jgi:amino acid adenylation domain-containing protein